MDQVNYFATISKVTNHTSQFPALLRFVSKYKVPWILKWRYNIEDRTVIRQYLVKWWGSYNHQKIIDQVMLEFPVKVPTPVKIPTPLQQVQPVKQEDPLVQTDSPTVSNIRLNSPAQRSSRPSKSKTKCSQLLMLAQQLIAQASQEEEDSSSEGSTTDKNPYGSAFQDAQDPFG
ncbi:hypothetical protein RHMOL_Rhmol02G0164800 [Rhododendron molle]|uniref:Uncharacterized protein n=1 Tax=Rhododendron molle TaxID=49168 RepID=A0ACC0PS72_RHOML|nr:hypothetical protein RHMOL_Rhmol02G0164800 [Rhododendron molle]